MKRLIMRILLLYVVVSFAMGCVIGQAEELMFLSLPS